MTSLSGVTRLDPRHFVVISDYSSQVFIESFVRGQSGDLDFAQIPMPRHWTGVR